MKSSRLLLAVLLATPALRADVIVVDAAGGGDFTTLTAAVAAAANGDTLLVHDGHYVEAGPVVIDGKGLTIAGEWFDPVFLPQLIVEPGLIVRNLAPTQNVVLQNMLVGGAGSSAAGPATPALIVQDNTAHVRVQSCNLVGGSGLHNDYPDGAVGVDVSSSLSTALVGCFVTGGDGQFSPDLGVKTGHGGAALAAAGGPVLVSSSVLFGGWGGSNIIGGWPDGGNGGAGLVHSSGTLLIVDGQLYGGQGGIAHIGGDGGQGLALGGSGVALLLAGSFASGGEGGSSNFGPDGADGLDIVDPAGLVLDFGGSAHAFDLTSPLREGQTGTLFLGGQPAQATLLFASASLHQIAFVGHDGVLMLAPTALIGPFPIGPPGNQQVPIVGPILPAGVESLLVHVQPAYVGGGEAFLGTGRVLTLLDAAF